MVLKWNVTLSSLPAAGWANCTFNEDTLTADPNSRKYRGEAYTCLIFLICELSAFTKTGMAAQLAWVHILGHWRCFLGRDETARNHICCCTPSRVFTSHTTCLTTWTCLLRAGWLGEEQIREDSKKEIPGADVFEKWLSSAGAFLILGMCIPGKQLNGILTAANNYQLPLNFALNLLLECTVCVCNI